MDRQTLINKVTIKIDEISQFGQGLLVSDENINVKPIDKTIDEMLDDATEEMLLQNPTHLLPVSKLTITLLADAYVAETTYDEDDIVSSGGINYISLSDDNTGNAPSSSPSYWSARPDIQPNISISDSIASVRVANDYLKLAYINFPCWQRVVTQTISESHPDYPKQKNEFTRGGFAKPVVVIRRDYTNRKYLDCYTVEDTTANKTGCELLYVKKSTPEMIPDNLVPALTTLTAAKVLGVFGKADLKAICEAEYNKLISLLLNT
jgi:hypothetical protein